MAAFHSVQWQGSETDLHASRRPFEVRCIPIMIFTFKYCSVVSRTRMPKSTTNQNTLQYNRTHCKLKGLRNNAKIRSYCIICTLYSCKALILYSSTCTNFEIRYVQCIMYKCTDNYCRRQYLLFIMHCFSFLLLKAHRKTTYPKSSRGGHMRQLLRQPDNAPRPRNEQCCITAKCFVEILF